MEELVMMMVTMLMRTMALSQAATVHCCQLQLSSGIYYAGGKGIGDFRLNKI